MAVQIGKPIFHTTIEPDQPRLVSMIVPWAGAGLLELLGAFPAAQRAYWRFDSSSAAYAGLGVVAVLSADGEDRFYGIRQQAQALFDEAVVIGEDAPQEAQPRLFGGFSYNANFRRGGIWAEFAPALFMLPHYQLTEIDGEMWLTVNVRMAEGDLDGASMLLGGKIHRLQNELGMAACEESTSNGEIEIDYLTEHDEWIRMIEEATGRIRRGDLKKVVLARAAELRTEQPIDPIQALAALDDRYPETYRFLIEPTPGHAFFGATPELLAKIDGERISTDALAGSIRRGATEEEDAMLGRELLVSAKDRHEHALVVESIREWLADLTVELDIDAEPSLRHLSNIQHLRTGIEGTLADGLDALHVVEALHPTPALGGTPRDVAVALIRELESQPRGWYGSPVGWMNAEGNGHFAVAIRSAVSAGNVARLYAGAGIVADSQAESEWQETALKFRPLLDALGSKS